MHKDELWQVYHKNGEAIPGEGWEARLGNPEVNGSDKIVGVAVVFLFRVREGGVEILWQKRSELVDRYPGDYDISAGGHINLGETFVEAGKREAFEEIGAEVTADELNFVTMTPFNKNRFAWIFAVDYTGKGDEFKFNDSEVSEVKWVPFSETDEFRLKFAKAPLKKDSITFERLGIWLSQHGYLDKN